MKVEKRRVWRALSMLCMPKTMICGAVAVSYQSKLYFLIQLEKKFYYKTIFSNILSMKVAICQVGFDHIARLDWLDASLASQEPDMHHYLKVDV